jgi:hypothetical protein
MKKPRKSTPITRPVRPLELTQLQQATGGMMKKMNEMSM